MAPPRDSPETITQILRLGREILDAKFDPLEDRLGRLEGEINSLRIEVRENSLQARKANEASTAALAAPGPRMLAVPMTLTSGAILLALVAMLLLFASGKAELIPQVMGKVGQAAASGGTAKADEVAKREPRDE